MRLNEEDGSVKDLLESGWSLQNQPCPGASVGLVPVPAPDRPPDPFQPSQPAYLEIGLEPALAWAGSPFDYFGLLTKS